MKKALILLLTFNLLLSIESSVNQKGQNELIQLANFLTENKLTIDHWQVTIREEISREEIPRIIEKMKEKYDVQSIKSENATKYLMEDRSKTRTVSESYSIIIPDEKRYTTELIAIIEGNSWKRSIAIKSRDKIETVLNTYFTSESAVYTCLSSKYGGIIKDVDFFNKLEKKLDLKYVSTQTDSIPKLIHNKTIYGYTEQWKEKIHMNDELINVQMTIQETNKEESKIIIGTPILIHEY